MLVNKLSSAKPTPTLRTKRNRPLGFECEQTERQFCLSLNDRFDARANAGLRRIISPVVILSLAMSCAAGDDLSIKDDASRDTELRSELGRHTDGGSFNANLGVYQCSSIVDCLNSQKQYVIGAANLAKSPKAYVQHDTVDGRSHSLLQRATVGSALKVITRPETEPADVTFGKGAIFGQIVELGSGLELSGVDVLLIGTDFVAKTGRDGRYAILDVPAGIYQIEYRRDGWIPQRESQVQIVRGEAMRSNIELELETYALATVEVEPSSRAPALTLARR